VVQALVRGGLLRKLSFTGSTAVGNRLAQLAAAYDLRCSLELGGDAPAVVLEDADPARAAGAIVAAKRRNAGQTCVAPNRVIVHARHARELADRLERELYRLRMGHALDPASELGPVIDEQAKARLEQWLGRAAAEGAHAGDRPATPARGCFVAPAVVRGVEPGSDLLGAELFGPVLPVIEVDDDADALRLARSGKGGLAAYVFCDDPVRGVGLGEELGVGMVAVNRGRLSEANAPFGGLGASGVGREGGLEGLEEYQSLVYSVVDAPSATQTELARSLDLSKSTAHNLLRTLEEIGWVHRDEARVYHLGSSLIALGTAATRRVSVVALAVRRLAGLPSEYGLSFAVAQLTPEGDAQVVERLYPTTDEHVGITVGSRYGDYAGALGKAVLALMPPAEATKAIKKARLESYTPRTIVDRDALVGDVEAVRARGWAASEGELNDNHAVVGFAPSSDPVQQIFLLALGFPSQLPHDLCVSLGERLAEIAAELNRQAGLQPAHANGGDA
jgi:DNA-binding IclR family transcriptional regulator